MSFSRSVKRPRPSVCKTALNASDVSTTTSISYSRRSTLLRPTSRFACVWRVHTSRSGSGEKAEAQYRLLLVDAPTHLEARLQLSGLYAQQGKLASALRVCQEALAHSPPDSALHKIYFTLGHLYHAQGRIEEAEASLERTLALEPTHAQAYNNLGNVYLAKNDLQQAATAYQKALEVAPDFAEAHYNLGHLYAQQQAHAKAERQYQAALRADSTYARAHYALGVLYQEAAQPRQAIRAYKRFLAQWQDDPRLTQAAQEALVRLADSQ